ncbi:MAG: esterase family protein [Rhodothermales bacterium]|nr:esterase family protein [Rhodothermales bacterium]
MKRVLHFAVLLSLLAPTAAHSLSSDSDLSYNKIFKSQKLGYDLHYRVYTPGGYSDLDSLPVIYVTDGQWYIQNGKVHKVMDQLVQAGKIKPAIVVFIDNRDPYNPSNNRRNSQFFCNRDYIAFITDELVPYIDGQYKTSGDRDDRIMLGLSFGALNSACFGLYAADTFRGIAMQSPALHPVRSILPEYESSEPLDLKIFLSTGTIRDNLEATRRFKIILDKTGAELEYVEVEASHDWNNWAPLIDDILEFYLGN